MKRFLRLFFLAFLTGFLNARIIQFLHIGNESTIILFSVFDVIVSCVLIFSRTKPHGSKALLPIYIEFSLSWLLWDISIRLIEGWGGSVSSLPRLPCELAGIFFAYRCFSKRLVPVTLASITLMLTIFISIHYLSPIAYNYASYGITHPAVQLPAPQNWHIVRKDTMLHNDYSKDKYIVLDFWSKSCGVCYKKFPLVDSLYMKYEARPEVEIVAVLLQSADSAANAKAQKTVSELYHFPVATGDTSTKRLFNILSLPTVIIVHNGDIIYKGDIEGVDNLLPQ